MIRLFVAWIVASCAVAASAAEALPPTAEQLFAVRVLPVLKAKCFACHGDDRDNIQGEFDVTSRAGMLRGGESGDPALVPNDPDKSPLYTAVTRRPFG